MDRRVRDEVYDVELRLLSLLSDFYKFDFRVLVRDQRELDELRPRHATLLTRERARHA
jgi:hypothetical protein